MEKNWAAIRCPYCGAEYHPSEIFMPEDLTGHPRNVIKDPLGKIMFVEWEEDGEPALVQKFTCDECGRTFIVEAAVTYKTTLVPEEEDFSTDSASLL